MFGDNQLKHYHIMPRLIIYAPKREMYCFMNRNWKNATIRMRNLDKIYPPDSALNPQLCSQVSSSLGVITSGLMMDDSAEETDAKTY